MTNTTNTITEIDAINNKNEAIQQKELKKVAIVQNVTNSLIPIVSELNLPNVTTTNQIIEEVVKLKSTEDILDDITISNTTNNNGEEAEEALTSKQQEFKSWVCDTMSLCEYYDSFIDHGFDEIDIVKLLNDEELKEIGVDKKGSRLKIILYSENEPAEIIDSVLVDTKVEALKSVVNVDTKITKEIEQVIEAEVIDKIFKENLKNENETTADAPLIDDISTLKASTDAKIIGNVTVTNELPAVETEVIDENADQNIANKIAQESEDKIEDTLDQNDSVNATDVITKGSEIVESSAKLNVSVDATPVVVLPTLTKNKGINGSIVDLNVTFNFTQQFDLLFTELLTETLLNETTSQDDGITNEIEQIIEDKVTEKIVDGNVVETIVESDGQTSESAEDSTQTKLIQESPAMPDLTEDAETNSDKEIETDIKDKASSVDDKVIKDAVDEVTAEKTVDKLDEEDDLQTQTDKDENADNESDVNNEILDRTSLPLDDPKSAPLSKPIPTITDPEEKDKDAEQQTNADKEEKISDVQTIASSSAVLSELLASNQIDKAIDLLQQIKANSSTNTTEKLLPGTNTSVPTILDAVTISASRPLIPHDPLNLLKKKDEYLNKLIEKAAGDSGESSETKSPLLMDTKIDNKEGNVHRSNESNRSIDIIAPYQAVDEYAFDYSENAYLIGITLFSIFVCWVIASALYLVYKCFKKSEFRRIPHDEKDTDDIFSVDLGEKAAFKAFGGRTDKKNDQILHDPEEKFWNQ